MAKSIVVCGPNLDHLPQTKQLLEENFEVIYINCDAEKLAKFVPKADAYYAALHIRITEELMKKSPNLKAITTPSTGLDHIDTKAADQLGIAVLSLKDDRDLLDRIPATAELTWALILACSRRFCVAVQAARKGDWARDAFRGHQIAYKTLGILGCGRLGTMVARYAQAFDMKVIGCDKLKIDIPYVEQVSFDELLGRCDILTIHIHLTEENKNLINRQAFAKIKRGAILINTSRGAIIDESAMLEALEDGRVSAAGLDVIVGEWRDDLADHPLITYSRTHENLIITPHVGGVTYESQEMAFCQAAQKLVEYL